MKRLALAVLLGFALAVGSSSAAATERAAAPVAKKPCKLVTKVVRGKRVKVRVCPKAKTKCKFVTKRVKGKKKRVRVCAKTKKKPATPKAPSPQPRTLSPEPPPPEPPPTAPADVLAHQLVAQVSQASDPEAGYQALLSIARALHIGVYTGDGRQVVEGAERSATDFWLYDFELDIVFGSWRAGRTQSLDEIATFLTASHTAGSEPITAERLRTALIGSARIAAEQPHSPRARLPLLLRELGLRQQPAYDLLHDVGAEQLRLDPLQILLITADLTARQQASTAAFELERTLAQVGCGREIRGSFAGIASFVAGALDELNVGADAHLANSLHLLLSVLSTTLSSQSTHYAPGPHQAEAGRELRFGILVTVGVPGNRFSPGQLTCGGLAGVTFPNPGSVPRANVEWKSFEGPTLRKPGELERHGTVATSVLTDPNGKAEYVLTPKREAVPGFGDEKEKEGTLQVYVDLASVFGNLPDGIQKASRARATFHADHGFAWQVSYHKPRGFKFSGVKMSYQTTEECAPEGGPCILSTTVSGRVCGDDPWAMPWDIHQTFTSNFGHATAADYPLELDKPFAIPEVGFHKGLEWVGATGPADYKVKFRYEVNTDWPATTPSSVTVPVEEDTSCPDNDT